MKLTLRLGNKDDLKWAQEIVTENHYLHRPIDNRARPWVYMIEYCYGESLGLVMVSNPHPTRCKGWFGYDELPTKWQVVDLCRIWLNPAIQFGGRMAKGPGLVPGFRDRKGVWRPTVATWAIKQVLTRIQKDWISLWPPVYINQPYHIRLVISYHDPKFHKGTIYKAAKAAPMYTDNQGNPKLGPSGKFGWCWALPEPSWSWQDINIIRPRTMRLPM